ncbi:MAG TPA: hypothetical protein VNO33_20385 [Kofleriaceae bacterium]|nr:hypothetical protein [Kofleriaceae bacterium]
MLARLKRKNLHTWLSGYARHLGRRVARRSDDGPRHLLFAMCDHYEPLWGKGTPRDVGDRRVAAWEERYPALADGFRDADGLSPRHSFFFPGEEYDPRFLERLARLSSAGHGEVELHLHHDGDTGAKLRRDIDDYLRRFAEHGHVSRDPVSGAHRFAFIHGNWCLANARRDGRWCGVDEEVQLLHEAGCYADFTFPSAPDECQPNRVNEIYWPTGDLRRRKAYASGEPARVGEVRRDRLLMITGPLALARRPGAGIPRLRIESSALSHDDPPSPDRLRTWVAQDIHVQGRPEWVFVKVHTHGAPERNADVLLGEQGRATHEALAREYNDGARWSLHYVTAREMFNIAVAAMEGRSGDPGQYRDHVIPPPPVALRARAAA